MAESTLWKWNDRYQRIVELEPPPAERPPPVSGEPARWYDEPRFPPPAPTRPPYPVIRDSLGGDTASGGTVPVARAGTHRLLESYIQDTPSGKVRVTVADINGTTVTSVTPVE